MKNFLKELLTEFAKNAYQIFFLITMIYILFKSDKNMKTEDTVMLIWFGVNAVFEKIDQLYEKIKK